MRYVTASSLNVRSAPTTSSTVLGTVRRAAPLLVLQTDSAGWMQVVGCIDSSGGGVTTEGWVAGWHTRPSGILPHDLLAENAWWWWRRFNYGAGKETVSPYAEYVGELWESVGRDHLDGRDTGEPWSAATISTFVAGAGSEYNRFAASAGHATFINQAIKAWKVRDRSVPFHGRRLSEARPEVGDLIGRWRGKRITYDSAIRTGWYTSHTDVVTSVGRTSVKVIGGNLSNSIQEQSVRLDSRGYISPGSTRFVLLKNITK